MTEKPQRILVLGGTKEAAELADRLAREGGHVIYSLAGRTGDPVVPSVEIRIGGFGGAGGLADFIRNNAIDLLIDATHPFARQISANARAAATSSGVPLQVITRKPWQQKKADRWIEVGSLEDAKAELPEGATVLLALGSQHIDAFESCKNMRFIIRMIDRPRRAPAFANHELLFGKPSSEWREEMAVLKKHAITHIVCRNSGGNGAYAKIRAARELGLPVIMIKQP